MITLHCKLVSLLALSVCAGVMLAGCEQSKPATPDRPAIAQPPPTAAGAAKHSPSGPVIGLPPVAPATSSDPHLPQHNELFNAFYKFVSDKGRVARNVEELVSAGYLAPLPPPPPGKKYHLDNQSLALRVVDK